MRRALLGSLVALVAATPAAAQRPTGIRATTPETGYVALQVSGPPFATARLSDRSTNRPADLGAVMLDAAGQATVARAATWACELRDRTFRADLGTAGSADTTLRTPSCRNRFRLAVGPRRPRAGTALVVTVRDRWRSGGEAMGVCGDGPAGHSSCTRVVVRPGARRAKAALAALSPGRWSVALRVPGVRDERDTVRVRPRSGRLRVVATGDSMIQLVDHALADLLAPVSVRSDARISTGISKPQLLDWVAHARRQATRHEQDVSVVFLGANDGFAIAGRQCCGRGWRRAYAGRASRMMARYARGGRATTYWNLLPAPRGAAFRRVYRAVNRAIRAAAREHPQTVRIVDLPKTFTPGYRFRRTIRWRGRTASVRQDDGVHLNVAGASIAAQLIARQMRRDGVL